jgi:glycolate oxidase FAD binding subunit
VDLSAYTIDAVTPARAERPSTSDEVARIIGSAHAERQAVVLHGGGTRIAVGEAPSRYDVALDLRDLHGVVEHSAPDLVCSVRAGTTLAELAAALAPARQRWPVDVGDPERATVGGTIASAAPSPARLRYQHPRDWVIGCEAVLGDGTRTRAGGRVVKNVTGYDLTRLYSGSYGTLAAITEINLKLVAIDESQQTYRIGVGPSELARVALALRAFPFEAIVAVSGRVPAIYARASGATEVTARVTAELGRYGAYEKVADAEWQALIARSVREETVARCAVPYGHELDVLDGDGLAYVGAGIAYALGRRTTEELAALRARCEALRGALVLERASPETKRALGVWGKNRTTHRVGAALKRRFDPHDVLAPGRLPLA